MSEELVGWFGMNAIWAIVQHSEDSELISFKQQMDSWYESGDIAARNYATYIDRHHVYKGLPQLYGTQLGGHNDFDTDSVNDRRMKMGMISIERYAAYMGIDWEEYVKKLKN